MQIVEKTVKELFPEAVEGLPDPMRDLPLKTYIRESTDEDHGFVPAVDPAFEFDSGALLALVLGDIRSRPVYFYGETGCGKSSSVRQFCARRGQEMIPQGFDDAIGRGELVGSVIPVVKEGINSIQFRYGTLASAMKKPAYLLLDEFDRGTPSATSVVNPVLETECVARSRLYIPETGELVVSHPDFRIVATGNTDGVSPDERGIYAGTQGQNMATLNRFAFRVSIPYNPPAREKRILAKKFAGFPDKLLDRLVGFVEAYRTSYTKARELSIPLSTRTVHAIAETTIFTGSLMKALECCVLASIPAQEREVVARLAKNCGIGEKS